MVSPTDLTESITKTRVLFLNARSDIGGGSRLMFELVDHLVNNSQYIIYVTCPNEKPFFDSYSSLSKAGKITLTALPLRKLQPGNLISLFKLVKGERIEIVVSHGKGAGFWARLLGVLTKTKVIHFFHGIHVSDTPSINERVYVFLERLFRHATFFHVCVSDSERSRAASLGFTNDQKTFVVHNGVDTQKYVVPSELERRLARKNTNVPDCIVILTVARLATVKNIPFALDIVSEYKNKVGPIRYLLVGGVDDLTWGYLMAEIRKRGLEEEVQLLGEEEDVRSFYHAADIYLSTSLWEGMPTTVLEAQSSGLPVVATNVVGNSNAVIEGKTGCLLPQGAVTAFVDKIQFLSQHPQLRTQFGLAGRENVLAHFTVQSMCREFVELLNSVCGDISKPQDN